MNNTKTSIYEEITGKIITALEDGVKGLLEMGPSDNNFYFNYYATQVMHHFGGQHWETWNRHLRDLLIIQKERRGRYAGSWDPQNYHYGSSGGRIYTTAMAICTLEVYYRHLPLFKKLDLE